MSSYSVTFDGMAIVQTPRRPDKYPGTVTPPLVLAVSYLSIGFGTFEASGPYTTGTSFDSVIYVSSVLVPTHLETFYITNAKPWPVVTTSRPTATVLQVQTQNLEPGSLTFYTLVADVTSTPSSGTSRITTIAMPPLKSGTKHGFYVYSVITSKQVASSAMRDYGQPTTS